MNIVITTNNPLDLQRLFEEYNLKGNPPLDWEKDFIKDYGLKIMSEKSFDNEIEEYYKNHPTTFSRNPNRGRESLLKSIKFSKNRWFKFGIFQRVSND